MFPGPPGRVWATIIGDHPGHSTTSRVAGSGPPDRNHVSKSSFYWTGAASGGRLRWNPFMPLSVTEYEDTPNPNALKCWLDGRISDEVQSYLRPDAAVGNALAEAIFEGGLVTTLLVNGDWLTVCRTPGKGWGTVKKHLERALSAHT